MKTYIILFVALAFVTLLPPDTGKSQESPVYFKPVGLMKPLSSPSNTKVVELDIIPITAQDYVRMEAKKYGWDTGYQWDAITTLLTNESGFRPTAYNASSGATGLFQFLDSTWASYGCVRTFDAGEQARCGLKYIKMRYGDPASALNFWLFKAPLTNGQHWY